MNCDALTQVPGGKTGLRHRRVLVTGGTGFIGANLVRRLVDEHADVHVLQRPGANPWRLADRAHKFTVHEAVVGVGRLTPLINGIDPHAIFHLATTRGMGVPDRYTHLQTGVLGAAQLIDALHLRPNCRLIIAGSSLEYAPSEKAIPETHPLAPSTLHGAVKAASSLLYEYAAKESGFAITQLRLFHVYGPWESPHRFLPTAIRMALAGKKLPLASAESRRDWVHVEDVVAAMIIAARQDAHTGIFNIASGREHSNIDILALLQQILGIPIATLPGALAARPTDSPHRFAEITRARERLDWMPRFDLERGIRHTVDWWRDHPEIDNQTDGYPPIAC
jgi:nucleoside-diphosphate-sugar epimerase